MATAPPLSLPFNWRWPWSRAPEEESSVAIAPMLPSDPTPTDLLRLAVSQNADLDKLTKLMDLQQRWEKGQAEKAFVAAMNAFKANPPEIVKNVTASFKTKRGDDVKWDYASLDHICDAVISALSQHGISHAWSFSQTGEMIRVTCVLTHALGHSRETALQGPPDFSGDKSPIHAIYSTVTHLERYTLLGAVGLAAGEPGGNGDTGSLPVSGDRTRENCSLLANAENLEQLQAIFRAAYAEAASSNDQYAQMAYIKAKDKRRKEIR